VIRRLAAARDEAPGAPGAPPRATPTRNAADPSDAALLFVRPAGTVFMVDAEGRHEVRITDTADVNNNAAWAPDRRRVLVSRQREPRGIHVVNRDGTGMTQVTAPPPGWADHMPVALGEGVAFVRVDSGGAAKLLYRVDLDGTGLARLTSGTRDDDPAPFPTGDRLAFSRDNEIYVLDLRRGLESRLTRTPAVHKAGVAVSPDGRRIAFSRTDPGRVAQIFVMNVDGSGTRRVSRGDFYEFLPRWSPDGTRLAFTSARDGTNGVYTMRLDGSDVRDVSRTPQALTTRPGTTVLQVTETLWAWMKY
jgi:Tol biopolymer transport system component